MGCFASKTEITEADKRSNAINNQLRQDHQNNKDIVKLLLLGPGESGKSTIFNQLKIIQHDKIDDMEKETMRHVVVNNLLYSIQALLRGLALINLQPNTVTQEEIEALLLVEDSEELMNYKSKLISLLTEPEIKEAIVKKKHDMHLIDQAQYFFKHVERFCLKDFQITEEDILRSRTKTGAVVEMEFTVPENKACIRIIDVGGQRNERKKWIHQFENVTSLIYVASLSDYNLTLEEDDTTNRMTECLTLFDTTVNNPYFIRSHIILILNKIDLFKEKIKRYDLKDYCFPDYTGGTDEEAALQYITEQFLVRNHSGKTIFVKVACALERENIDFIFKSVKEIVFQNSLALMFDG